MGENAETPVRRRRPNTISLQESEALLSHPGTARIDRWIYRDTNDDEVPDGYHRVIGTYDDLVPVSWIDVPDGTADPSPNYLSTSAAKAYLEEPELPSQDLPERRAAAGGTHASRSRRWLATAMLLAVILQAILMVLGPHDNPALLCSLAIGTVAAFAMLMAVTAWPLPLGGWQRSRREIASPAPADAESGDEGAEDVLGSLRSLRSNPHVGDLAGRGVAQAEESRKLHDRLLGLVGDRFSEGSISWHRFADGCEAGCGSIDRNVAAMAEIAADADGRGRRHALSTLVDDNEGILEGLRALEEELLRLAVDEMSQENREVAEDLSRMSDDVRHYRFPEKSMTS